jgi:hypothetical protein
MKIPHLKFIEALVVSKFTLDRIQEELEKYGLEYNKKAIAIVMNTLRDEMPDYFKGTEPVNIDWIRDLGVLDMYAHLTHTNTPEKMHPVKNAFDLINDPLMFRLVTSMCVAGIDKEDIDLLESADFNRQYGVEDINIFIKYFFDMEDWTLKERQDYVRTIENTQLSKFYKIALKGDKPYLMWKLGATPEKDFGIMLKDVVNDSYFKFKEDSKIRPELAQKWATLLLRYHDRIQDHEKDKAERGNKFIQNFEFKIKTIADIEEEDERPKHISDLK